MELQEFPFFFYMYGKKSHNNLAGIFWTVVPFLKSKYS